ncbi:hypothetical protein BATDEDRAFT_23496 [Batrachochytrium dendrobatidis JAM81]|uniref:Uncharacterized protein n=1 Tax=Batrachochytrium dendrobatidis (strain JAM81 / FGSC 10211) TaxID=684364 RepID=F4NZ73_BATDJ|nr:uncharacterized protein BATDEDRAFT_23496 [Batrachochytrium dendrobatidis JAM81]EGF82148.1 hypothetical protein BATDEDRAFT_23496 [Batrachochytrium dendrobatidis JAM81]|eukprot:XP_006677298.1 hypothetical protein BATDEDRAFT_23496 [Batrachochytrium dendrobatidis JAM81]
MAEKIYNTKPVVRIVNGREEYRKLSEANEPEGERLSHSSFSTLLCATSCGIAREGFMKGQSSIITNIVFVQSDNMTLNRDNVAEWLRRLTRNQFLSEGADKDIDASLLVSPVIGIKAAVVFPRYARIQEFD